MEYIAISILYSFLCVFFYLRGVKDGKAIGEGRAPEIKKPEFLKTKAEKEEEKKEQEAIDESNSVFSYQPLHIGKKRGE
jgi:hypothetical protein